MTAVVTPLPSVEPSDPDITLALYEADNSTLIAEFASWDVSFKSTLLDATTGSSLSFSLPFDSDIWPQITADTWVRVVIRGTPVDPPYRCRTVNPTPIPEKTGAAPTVAFTGVSLVSALDDYAEELRPDTASFAGNTNRRLISGWQLPEFDASGWPTATIGSVGYDPMPPLALFSPFAYWITHPDAENGDTLLFVYDYAQDEPIFVPRRTAKGGCRAWLNGFPIGDTPLPPASNAKEKMYRWPVNQTSTGTNRLAIEVVGPEDAIPELIGEFYAVNNATTGKCDTDSFLFQTGYQVGHGPDDDTPLAEPWKVYRVSGDTRPGLTVGQIIATHIEEGQDSGQFDGLTTTFDTDDDTATDAWPEVQNLITDVLKRTPDLLVQLAQSEADIWPSAEGLELNAVGWRQRGDYHTTPTAPKLVGGENIDWGSDGNDANLAQLAYTQQLVPDDVTILYRYRDGYGKLGTGPIRPYDFGDVDAQAAASLAQAMLDARPDKAVTYSVTLLPPAYDTDDRCIRFPEDRWLGDALSVPAGVPAVWANQRIVSVSGTLNNAGRMIPVVELSSPQTEVQATFDRRLARIHAGTANESIPSPDKFGTDIEGGEVREREMTFFKEGPVGEGAQSSGFDPLPPERQRFFRFECALTAAGADYSGADLVIYDDTDDATPTVVHSFAMEAGEKATVPGDGFITAYGVKPNMARMVITHPGDGAEQWTAKFYTCPPI